MEPIVGNSDNKKSSGIKVSLELFPSLPLDEEMIVAWYGEEGVNGVDGKIPTQLDSLFCLQLRIRRMKERRREGRKEEEEKGGHTNSVQIDCTLSLPLLVLVLLVLEMMPSSTRPKKS